MLIVDWTPIIETEEIPPLGPELAAHLESRRGAVRYASCSAWGLLFQTIRRHGLPQSTVAFTESGKPFFRGNAVYFSISHSKDVCAVAVSSQPVGIDVERRRDRYSPRLIERSLTEPERTAFDGDFTRVWCRKEAVAKLTGKGIAGYPNYLDTTAYQFEEKQIEHAGWVYWLVTATV